ncbi:MAG: ABC transporter substrate-binding protein [Rhizobiaceae bacterium MnEN-MB40S]|nr:MAG: ABC transporter substrate-binding protein [Rhizobiaceae bacterium MnEN-MB40S]
MKVKLLCALLFVIAATIAPSRSLLASECGEISIARMHWQSAALLAEIDKLILTEGYGCPVTLVPGDTIPTFQSMNERGAPDVAPELWINSIREQLDKAVDEQRLFYGAKALADGGIEGWWIPHYVALTHPHITNVAEALKHPEIFIDPEDPEKGAVHNCPPDWSCSISTRNLFKAFEAEKKGFRLVEASSAEELRKSIIDAFEGRKGWLGYYWAPTALLGRYDMVRLSFGAPYNKTEWDSCTAVADCEDPKPNGWPSALAYTVVTKKMRDASPRAFDYLSRRSWHNSTINRLLAWMEENDATPEQAARHFLEEDDEIWMRWVTLDAANKIGGALDD